MFSPGQFYHILADSTSCGFELVFFQLLQQIFSTVFVSCRLFIKLKSSGPFKPASHPFHEQQLSCIGNICQLIKSQGKTIWYHLPCFKLTIGFVPSVLNSWSSFSRWKANSVKFIFVTIFFPAAAIKHNLISSPLINTFSCLANKWAICKLTLLAASFSLFIFVKKSCCD